MADSGSSKAVGDSIRCFFGVDVNPAWQTKRSSRVKSRSDSDSFGSMEEISAMNPNGKVPSELSREGIREGNFRNMGMVVSPGSPGK